MIFAAERRRGRPHHTRRRLPNPDHDPARPHHRERVFFDRDYQGTNRVFTWENRRDIHPDVIRQRFNRFAQRCGLPHIRLHDMRHTYATISLKAGVNPKIVSARLGHSSVGFTLSVYSHALPGMDRDAANDIAALVLGEQDTDSDGSVSKSVSTDGQNAPGDDLSEGVSPGSGGRI